MTKIKLCGLTGEEDIIAVNALQPDYAGFVFAPKSKRLLTKEKAKVLREQLQKEIQTVGVFQNNPLEEVVELVQTGIISVVQLHGAETNGYLQSLREQVDCVIIQAVGINALEDIEKANTSIADFVLLDKPGGGTGETFPHSLLEHMKREYFLAGGLGAENVEGLVKTYHPYGVDVSSKIETEGKKDPEKMKAFVELVRACEKDL